MNSTKKITVTLSHETAFGQGWEETGFSSRDLREAFAQQVKNAVADFYPTFEISTAWAGIAGTEITVEGVEADEADEIAEDVTALVDSLPDLGEMPIAEICQLLGKIPSVAP